MIKITDVAIRRKFEDDGRSKLLGVASIVIDNCFVVHDIKIIKGINGRFIAMPSRSMAGSNDPKSKFTDVVHPINKETRAYIEEEIYNVFDKTEVTVKTDEENGDN